MGRRPEDLRDLDWGGYQVVRTTSRCMIGCVNEGEDLYGGRVNDGAVLFGGHVNEGADGDSLRGRRWWQCVRVVAVCEGADGDNDGAVGGSV